jgi:hypothetical protein
MSASTLTNFENGLTVYGYAISMILGNIGNVFIVMIFHRQRHSACAIYLICAAVMNNIYLTYDGIATIFMFYYPNETTRVNIFCKIYKYILYTFGQEGKTMIVFACIDRFLITSSRASFRAFSTPKRAKYLIFFSLMFWALSNIHVPIMIGVFNGQCTTHGVYSIVYSVYTIMFVSLIPTITSAIFGYLTYRNMKQLQMRVHPGVQHTVNTNVAVQRRDRDLLIIVIAEVVIYFLTTALFPLILIEMLISQYVMPNKSLQYSQIEVLMVNIAIFLLFINTAAPFYTYLISSKSFRREFKQLIINSYLKLTRQTPAEIVSRTNRTVTQRETRV